MASTVQAEQTLPTPQESQIENAVPENDDILARMDQYWSQSRRSPLSHELDAIFDQHFAMQCKSALKIELVVSYISYFLVTKSNGVQLVFRFDSKAQMVVRDLGDYDFHVGFSHCKFGYCSHTRTHYIDLLVNGAFSLRFGFDESADSFFPFHCLECPNTTEDHLYPQYVEFIDGRPIFHMWNSELATFEQYEYHSKTLQLVQVYHPGHPFDASRIQRDTVLFTMPEPYAHETLITREISGQVGKLRHFPGGEELISVPKRDVKTMAVQRFESFFGKDNKDPDDFIWYSEFMEEIGWDFGYPRTSTPVMREE